MENKFYEIMAGKSTAELLKIIELRAEYEPDAVEAAELELSKRKELLNDSNISEEAISSDDDCNYAILKKFRNSTDDELIEAYKTDFENYSKVEIEFLSEELTKRNIEPKIWYFSKENVKKGPFTATEMKSLAQKGELDHYDYVWREGLQNWILANKVGNLFMKKNTPPSLSNQKPDWLTDSTKKEKPANMENKVCPFCAEEIKIEAIKCKHCGELLESKKEDSIEYEDESKLLTIPKAWFTWKIIKWVGIVLVFLLIRAIRNLPPSEIDNILSLLSSIISIGAVFFLYLLVKYVGNFIKEFPSLKIYFWLSIVGVIFGLWFSINELSSTPTEPGSFFIIIALLLTISWIVCQFIASLTLMRIKNDTVGGLKTIGTTLFIFVFIDIFWFFIYLIVGVWEGINEEFYYEETTSDPSSFVALDIIVSLTDIAFSFLIIHLVSKTLRKAMAHNQKITRSDVFI